MTLASEASTARIIPQTIRRAGRSAGTVSAQCPATYRIGTCIGPWLDSCARYANVDLPPPALARIHCTALAVTASVK